MLIDIILAAGLTAVGALAARAWVGRRAEAARSEPAVEVERRELRVGDVILDRASNEAHWLAGALELDEEGRIRRLFRALDAERVAWIAELSPGEGALLFLGMTVAVPEGRVPEELRVDSRRLTLRWRTRVRVRAQGEHLPQTEPQADVCLLRATGGAALMVVDFDGGERLSLLGETVDRDRLDVLPAGDRLPPANSP